MAICSAISTKGIHGPSPVWAGVGLHGVVGQCEAADHGALNLPQSAHTQSAHMWVVEAHLSAQQF